MVFTIKKLNFAPRNKDPYNGIVNGSIVQTNANNDCLWP